MIADAAARQRALDVSTSFIVQAPAGSGKTELLIQRFLKLLTTADVPDAVVAITFTRKAAGEMRARVMEALRTAQSGIEPQAEHQRLTFQISRDVLDRDASLGWQLLRNPARLRIETIDALCASITRRMPWLARFGAMPEVSEKAEDLYREAAQNTLRHLERGHQGLANLLLHLDNDFQRARQLIRGMLERRDQWLRHTGATPDFDALRIELESSLERLIVTELKHLNHAATDNLSAELAFLCELDELPEARLEDLPAWARIADLLLTKRGDLRKRAPSDHPFKARCEELLSSLRSEEVLIERLARVRELPPARFTDSQWRALEAIISVLALAVAELQLVFGERGRVDFAELAIRASAALGQVDAPEDLALALAQRIQHILVDEFQDTSYTQFELIEKLTAGWDPGDGRTLFLVGDPMQSIYRFRQAEVGLFWKARAEGIGAIRLEPLTLTVNFRSRPGIVEWVNQTFASVLPASDEAESGAIAYSPSVAGTAGEDAVVRVHAVRDETQEARRVLELIEGAAGGTIAILVRSRAHLIEIVSLLKQRRIAFQAIEIDQLGERQIVEDLMALTFALLHAADRVSWLAILRAPWCGLTLEDLHTLAAVNHHATIWELLHQPNIRLSDEGRMRVNRILAVLDQGIAERGRVPLRDLVERTWLQIGGPACIEDETALEDAAAYFDLLEGMAEGAELADFRWFRGQVDALFAQPDVNATERLQLMTIHKAKGLEFDTVILPGLGTVPRSDDQRLLVWLEHRGELLFAPIAEAGAERDPIYSYLSGIDRRKTDQETARLLYVAATRARRALHLVGCAKVKQDGSVAEPDARSFLNLLWPVLFEHFTNVIPAKDDERLPRQKTVRRLPADWRMPDPPQTVHWKRPQIERLRRPEIVFERANDRLRYAGAAVHLFLQRIAREGLGEWNESAIGSHQAAYRAVLSNLGVPTGDLAWAVERVQQALTRTLRDPRGRWLLDAHAAAASELPVAGFIGGLICEAVIDRTFVDEDGVRWIIDYKTSSHEGAGVENFLEQEKERYREQLERYARLMAQFEDRPIRLGLYFPLLGEWIEWAAPEPMRKQALLFEL